MSALPYVGFVAGWTLLLYLLDSAYARTWKRPVWTTAVAVAATTCLIGLFGEIALNTAWNAVFGEPLWVYKIAPVYNGYTSTLAAATWGVYGFHLYMLHDTLKGRGITSTKVLAGIISIEALFAEAALTLSARPVFGEFLYYYYYPDGLWHVSAFQNIPCYFVFGVIYVKTMRRVHADPCFWTAASLSLSAVLVWVAHTA